MKKVFTLTLVLVAFASFAQTTTGGKTSTQTTSSSKASKLINTWNLYQTETFNATHVPTSTQLKDQLIILPDGHYRLIYNGVAEGGTYVIDATAANITLTSGEGTVKKLKVMESTATSLKVDYKDETEIHNILYYSTTATTATTGTTTGK